MLLRQPGVALRQLRRGPLVVNRAHPLARNMTSCWVPGVNGLLNATFGFPFSATYQSAASLGSHVDGPGLVSTGANSGLNAVVGTSPLYGGLSNQVFSLSWRGYIVGTPAASGTFISISYDSGGNPPFIVLGIDVQSGPAFRVDGNSGGSFIQSTTGSAVTVGLFNLVATLDTANASLASLYVNGSLNTTAAAVAGGPTSTATSTMVLGCSGSSYSNSVTFMATSWNRVLSLAEIQWLNLDPYCFLVRDIESIALMKGTGGGAAFLAAWALNRNTVVDGVAT